MDDGNKKQKPDEYHSYLIVDTYRTMRDAHANKEYHKFYSFFTSLLEMVTPVLDVEIRARINADHEKLKKMIAELYDAEMHEADREKKIERLELFFAESHQNVVYSASSRVNLLKPRVEGLIDFDSTDIDTFSRGVRGDRSVNIAKATEARE
jgi:hypothetical protein